MTIQGKVPEQTISDIDAVGIAEGWIEASEDRQTVAWQHLIDTGLAWTLQGWFGRTAMQLLKAGVIHR